MCSIKHPQQLKQAAVGVYHSAAEACRVDGRVHIHASGMHQVRHAGAAGSVRARVAMYQHVAPSGECAVDKLEHRIEILLHFLPAVNLPLWPSRRGGGSER